MTLSPAAFGLIHEAAALVGMRREISNVLPGRSGFACDICFERGHTHICILEVLSWDPLPHFFHLLGVPDPPLIPWVQRHAVCIFFGFRSRRDVVLKKM